PRDQRGDRGLVHGIPARARVRRSVGRRDRPSWGHGRRGSVGRRAVRAGAAAPAPQRLWGRITPASYAKMTACTRSRTPSFISYDGASGQIVSAGGTATVK